MTLHRHALLRLVYLDGHTSRTRVASSHGLVRGFGNYGQPDQIDLQDIAFGTTKKSQTHLGFTEAASTLSGTLAVTDGVHAANIQVVGFIHCKQVRRGE